MHQLEMLVSSGFDLGLDLDVMCAADVNRRSLFGGWTALMWAAHVGWEEGCRLLLSAGAETSPMNTQGLSALNIALQRGHASLEPILWDTACPSPRVHKDLGKLTL